MFHTEADLAGRFRLESRIAAGGVGEVWQAVDLVVDLPVAVKMLRAGYAWQPETLARFRAEAQHAGSVSHPGIAQIYHYDDGDPPVPPYLVMELVRGPSLARVLARGPLAPARAMDVIGQVAAALDAAHQAGLVHRDVKPSNLLVGPGGQMKIIDFGIAHAAGSAPLTRTGALVGTPDYLAPELAAGASATPASDLYSLGVVAYECLVGLPPFSGQALEVAVAHRDRPLPPLPANVPMGVAALVNRLTAKDPRARPAGADQVSWWAHRLRDSLLAGPDAQPRSRRPVPGHPDAAGPGYPAGAGPGHPAGAGPGHPAVARSGRPAGNEPATFPGGLEPPTLAGDGPGTLAGRGPGALAPVGPGTLAGPGSGTLAGPGSGTLAGPGSGTLAGVGPVLPVAMRVAGPRRSPPRRPSQRRPPYGRNQARSRWKMVLAGAAGVAAALVVVLVTGIFRTASPQQPLTASSGSATHAAVRLVQVHPGALVGQPVAVVVKKLDKLGLRAHVVQVVTGKQPVGRAVSVKPGGKVPAGSLITVMVAVQASPAPSSPAPLPSATPSPSPSTGGGGGGDD